MDLPIWTDKSEAPHLNVFRNAAKRNRREETIKNTLWGGNAAALFVSIVLLIFIIALLTGCSGYRSLVRDVVEAADEPVKSIDADYERKKVQIDFYQPKEKDGK